MSCITYYSSKCYYKREIKYIERLTKTHGLFPKQGISWLEITTSANRN